MEALGIIMYERSGSKLDSKIPISTLLHSLGKLLNPPPLDMILGLAYNIFTFVFIPMS